MITDTFNTIRPLSRKQIDDFWKALPPIKKEVELSIHNNLWHCPLEEIRAPYEREKIVHEVEKPKKRQNALAVLLDFDL